MSSILTIKPESYEIKSQNELPLPGMVKNLHSALHESIYEKILTDIVGPEISDILFEIYRLLDPLVPNQLDYLNILNEDEINEQFISLARVIGYQPNYQFLAKWSESLTGPGVRNLRKELEARIQDLYTISYRRKFYGSYLGYKQLFYTMFRHGSVYIVGNYGVKNLNENYNRGFRLIDYEKSILKFLPYSNTVRTKYPYTGYLDGYTDSFFYPANYLQYDSGLRYDETELENPLNYTLQYDIQQPVYYDQTIFLEISLDRLLRHINTFQGTECIQDIQWLDYIENQVQSTKRVLDKVRVGSQMTLVTDTSGLYTKIDSPYTHPDIQAKFFVFRSRYLNNKNIVRIELGTGGSSKAPWFKSIMDVAGVPLFGEGSLYDHTLYVDPELLQNTTFEADTTDIAPQLENSLFESPVGTLEKIENVAGDFDFIHVSVYPQKLEGVKDLSLVYSVSPIIDTVFIPELSSGNNTSYIFDYEKLLDTVNSLEINNLTKQRVQKLEYRKQLPRRKITPGSLDLWFIIHPLFSLAQNPFRKQGNQFFSGSQLVQIQNMKAFLDNFWIEGTTEDVNPFWQYVNIRDEYDKFQSRWVQRVRVYKKVKKVTPLGEYYDYEDITDTDDSLVKVFPGLTYTYDPLSVPTRTLEVKTQYVDYKSGLVSLIFVRNMSSFSFEDEYLPLRDSMGDVSRGIELKKEIWYTFEGHLTPECYSILQPDLIFNNDVNVNLFSSYRDITLNYFDGSFVLPKVGGLGVFTFYVNTTKNLADSSDTKSGIVSITEMGLFNSDDEIVAYAVFPPVIYDSFKNHLSFNIFIKNNPIIPVL